MIKPRNNCGKTQIIDLTFDLVWILNSACSKPSVIATLEIEFSQLE